MLLPAAALVKQIYLQEMARTHTVVHQMQHNWQHVPHQRTGSSEKYSTLWIYDRKNV